MPREELNPHILDTERKHGEQEKKELEWWIHRIEKKNKNKNNLSNNVQWLWCQNYEGKEKRGTFVLVIPTSLVFWKQEFIQLTLCLLILFLFLFRGRCLYAQVLSKK